MINLLKHYTLVLAVIPLVVCTLLVSNAHARYQHYPAYSAYSYQFQRTGLYLGGSLGFDTPEGPDQQGMYTGVGWSFSVGYEFIPQLALELGYHQSVGDFSTYAANGTWTFFQIPYLHLKPMIPLPNSNLYFIIGLGYDGAQSTTNDLQYNITTSSYGPGVDLGFGYEWYVTPNFTLGGETIYHYYSNNTFTVSGGGASGTVTSPYEVNMSYTSWNFTLLYHF